jgi:spore maturation protein CgeB
MKIILLFPNRGHTGPKVIRGFGYAFEALGHEVIWLSRDKHVLPLLNPQRPRLQAELKEYHQLLQEHHPDFIFSYSTSAFFTAETHKSKINIYEQLECPYVAYFGEELDLYLDSVCGFIRASINELIGMHNSVIFVSCRDSLERYGSLTERMFYLPFGCNTLVYNPMLQVPGEITERYSCQVSFVGNFTEFRQEYLSRLGNGMPLNIYGRGWHRSKLNGLYKGILEDERHLYPLYRSSRINLWLRGSPDHDSINMRQLEIVGSKGFLLTHSSRQIEEFFEPGQEVATYSDPEELREKISYYLRHEEQRQRIAENGYRKVRASHTYVHRAKRLLDILRALGLIR